MSIKFINMYIKVCKYVLKCVNLYNKFLNMYLKNVLVNSKYVLLINMYFS
jgi:hypothetical protein